MPISLSCPTCGKRFRVSDEKFGMQAKCPYCLAVILIPGQSRADPPGQDAQPIVQEYDTDFEPPVVARRSKRKKQREDFDDAEESGDTDSDSRSHIKTKYCHECGRVIRLKAEICPKCGVRQPDWDEEERLVRKRGRDLSEGIKNPILVSAISNAVFGLMWAYTCIGIVVAIPMIILCVCEFMLWSQVDDISLKQLSRKAKTIGIFEIIVGLFLNIPTLICGIIVYINSGKIYNRR